MFTSAEELFTIKNLAMIGGRLTGVSMTSHRWRAKSPVLHPATPIDDVLRVIGDPGLRAELVLRAAATQTSALFIKYRYDALGCVWCLQGPKFGKVKLGMTLSGVRIRPASQEEVVDLLALGQPAITVRQHPAGIFYRSGRIGFTKHAKGQVILPNDYTSSVHLDGLGVRGYLMSTFSLPLADFSYSTGMVLFIPNREEKHDGRNG